MSFGDFCTLFFDIFGKRNSRCLVLVGIGTMVDLGCTCLMANDLVKPLSFAFTWNLVLVWIGSTVVPGPTAPIKLVFSQVFPELLQTTNSLYAHFHSFFPNCIFSLSFLNRLSAPTALRSVFDWMTDWLDDWLTEWQIHIFTQHNNVSS